jgi:iron complex outermembrane receptor protein
VEALRETVRNVVGAFLSTRQFLIHLSGHKTETEVIGAATTPAPLAGLEEVLFDREQTQRWTCGQPEDNVRLSAGWRRRTLAGTVRVSRYGAHCFATNVAANDQTFGAKWLTDVELARESSRVVFGLGVQNLFDVFPDRLSTANSSFVVQTFPNTSPFGMNGRFLYVRASYRF